VLEALQARETSTASRKFRLMAERKLADDSGEDQHTGQDGRDPRHANATPSGAEA
jgi:hypothetical protein